MYSHKVETHELNNSSIVLEGCRGLYEEVLLQIDSAGEFQVVVSGAIKDDLPLYNLALIDMKDFEAVEHIEVSGLYLLSTKGLGYLSISASGEVSITAKFLSDRG